jgi:hypothetical protein
VLKLWGLVRAIQVFSQLYQCLGLINAESQSWRMLVASSPLTPFNYVRNRGPTIDLDGLNGLLVLAVNTNATVARTFVLTVSNKDDRKDSGETYLFYVKISHSVTDS